MHAGILLLSAAAVLAASVPASAGDLTAAEIRGEIVGRDIHWWESEGWHTGSLYLGADGLAEVVVERPGRQDDTGSWRLEGGKLCTAWGALRAGGEKCYALRRAGKSRYVTTGGNVFEIREIDA